MKKIVLTLITSYQKFISSSFVRLLFLKTTCKFAPTCSVYTYQAVTKYGTMQGLLMGLKRILRCHPLSRGGYDPVK